MSKAGKYRRLSSRKERVNLPFPHVFTHFQPPVAWGGTHPHWGGPSSLLGLLNPKACLFQKHLYRHVPAQSFNSVQLFANPQTVAHQDPLSKEFSRQEYWSGLPCRPPPGDLPHPEIEPVSLESSALVSRFFTTSATWGACYRCIIRNTVLPFFILSVTECILRQWIGIIFSNLSTYSGVLGLTPGAGLTCCIPCELVFPRKFLSEYRFPWSKYVWEILCIIDASHGQVTFS